MINPGVYELEGGKRINDALVAAGGLAAGADREWVEKNINRSSLLIDGQKIYIPRQQQKQLGGQAAEVKSNLININTASESQLDTLSGIGPVTAGKIINNRPYSQIEELTSKKVVSQKVFDQIKDKITAY